MKKPMRRRQQKTADDCRTHKERRRWRDENEAAIQAYNTRVSKSQILSDYDPLF
jgi:hypothetical protein